MSGGVRVGRSGVDSGSCRGIGYGLGGGVWPASSAGVGGCLGVFHVKQGGSVVLEGFRRLGGGGRTGKRLADGGGCGFATGTPAIVGRRRDALPDASRRVERRTAEGWSGEASSEDGNRGDGGESSVVRWDGRGGCRRRVPSRPSTARRRHSPERDESTSAGGKPRTPDAGRCAALISRKPLGPDTLAGPRRIEIERSPTPERSGKVGGWSPRSRIDGCGEKVARSRPGTAEGGRRLALFFCPRSVVVGCVRFRGVVPGDRNLYRSGVMMIIEYVLLTQAITILWRTVFGSDSRRK